MKIKDKLIAIGVTGTITLLTIVANVSVLKSPAERILRTHCKNGEVMSIVNKQILCIENNLNNRRLTLVEEINTRKTDKDGKGYDIEIGNWNLFWKTLNDTADLKGLTKEDLQDIIDQGKPALIDYLTP